jgi:hypothetical protein
MNLGVPPTAWKARTGEFTPPGTNVRAYANSSSERVVPVVVTVVVTASTLADGPDSHRRERRSALAEQELLRA